eukprot:CAMPEP_0184497716 /NCGR_PEP_ID=MMETSP0113_2-20130426/37272_1 /TAXON_ID=91329 /ORGANISM="Norrisiella sphaerica, Strain BC52" /LENGTH=48 /DNA_ID= /DNA_START= /DNA_END= /DNA_ORIENTATION=
MTVTVELALVFFMSTTGRLRYEERQIGHTGDLFDPEIVNLSKLSRHFP